MANQDDFIRTALRVPPDLHRQIHEAARASNRTFNAEIIARLLASFVDQAKQTDDSGLPAAIPEQSWKTMLAKLAELDAEVKALPLKLRQVPEGTVVIKDKFALIKHLGTEPTGATKKRAISKKKDDGQKS